MCGAWQREFRRHAQERRATKGGRGMEAQRPVSKPGLGRGAGRPLLSLHLCLVGTIVCFPGQMKSGPRR